MKIPITLEFKNESELKKALKEMETDSKKPTNIIFDRVEGLTIHYFVEVKI